MNLPELPTYLFIGLVAIIICLIGIVLLTSQSFSATSSTIGTVPSTQPPTTQATTQATTTIPITVLPSPSTTQPTSTIFPNIETFNYTNNATQTISLTEPNSTLATNTTNSTSSNTTTTTMATTTIGERFFQIASYATILEIPIPTDNTTLSCNIAAYVPLRLAFNATLPLNQSIYNLSTQEFLANQGYAMLQANYSLGSYEGSC